MLKKSLDLHRTAPKMLGVSVIGPSHVRKRIPNQDSFLTATCGVWHLAVVSDGVGSCPLSHIGSRQLCASLVTMLRRTSPQRFDKSAFLEGVREEWLRRIRPLSFRQASATCLFSLTDGKRLFVAMLGDGCIGVMRRDGKVVMLMEDKNASFSNITASMTRTTGISAWRSVSMAVTDLYGVMLATDGVADDLSRPDDFTREILTSSASMGAAQARQGLIRMLKGWPAPGHSDDKTIACMIFDGECNA